MTAPLRPAKMHELDRAGCLALLATQAVGRLISTEKEPSVVPVNYLVVADAVVFRTDASFHATQAGAALVFEVDAIDDRHHGGWSVVARGTIADITDGAGVDVDVREHLESWAPGPKDRWFRLSIETVTGRWLEGAEQPPTSDGRGYL
jgi:nitroimidazol reductase NimA-like FMN-containing flavoprotein (pyridoxamine 5'-phosphate oxidase superfamily)